MKRIQIEKAYCSLSQEAFAAWILMCSTTGIFYSRGEVAELLAMSYTQSNRILRELKSFGAVAIEPAGHTGQPTTVRVTAAPAMTGRGTVMRGSR